jgi:hypothetical protein
MKINRTSKSIVLVLAALCGAASMPACGLSFELDRLSDGAGDTGPIFGATSGGGSGGGGGGQDASITITQDSGGKDAKQPYADLCGSGICSIGGDDCEQGTAGGEPQETSCQLVPGEGAAVSECAPVGTFDEGEPCNSANNCAAGLGCAATPNAGGVCRSYCCGDVESCPANTYCEPQEMAEDTINTPRLEIPVCIPVTPCQLLNEKSCTAPLTCTIVRADGTTSCVMPGQGEINEDCPCAAGYVCSKLQNKCLKLCDTDMPEAYCGAGMSCFGGNAGFPEGVGVCG